MSKLPCVSGRQCVDALRNAGFYLKWQKGSHMTLRRDNPFTQLVVPDHRELDRGHAAGHYSASGFECR